MPELPEVESFTRNFSEFADGKVISSFSMLEEKLLIGGKSQDVNAGLQKNSVIDCSRRGKYMLVTFSKQPQLLVFHFGMTGSFEFDAVTDELPRFTRAFISFEDGSRTNWINARKLGKIYWANSQADIPAIPTMGPEPFDMTFEQFDQILQDKRRRSMKAILMDQTLIAGIGNEYSDEILFAAHVLPDRVASDLSGPERHLIFSAMATILREAIELRIASSDAPIKKPYLFDNRRPDIPCPVCSTPITKKTINSRSSFFCTACQK